MNKSDLISNIFQDIDSLNKTDIGLGVNQILEIISFSLQKKDRVEIRGFGTFSLHNHNSRTARNPKTGELVALEKRYSIHFKPSKELKTRVNNKN